MGSNILGGLRDGKNGNRRNGKQGKKKIPFGKLVNKFSSWQKKTLGAGLAAL